jgi:hypothetical protein
MTPDDPIHHQSETDEKLDHPGVSFNSACVHSCPPSNSAIMAKQIKIMEK